MLFCAIFVLLAMLGLLANMYHLQVQEHQALQTRSNDNRIKLLPLAPNRGLIYDRNGVLLAENMPVYSLEIVPEEIADMSVLLNDLKPLLSLDEETLNQFREQLKRQRRFAHVTLVDEMNEQQLNIFAANQHRFPGVSIEARLVRHYPYGELFTHALGYVAKINRRDVERLREEEKLANYAATRTIGKLGVERFYEDKLHGEVGYQRVEVNNRGRVIRTVDIEPPKPGQDIYLEIDSRLQRKATELLKGRRGSIIMMDARNGGILTMVSAPSYDPNWFVNGISYKHYQQLLNSSDSPLLNRSTQGGYPPASTVKPMLAILGLEDEIITPTTRIWDPGWFEIKGAKRRYRDWLAWGHGWVNVSKAIIVSCDTFFYDLALKLGIDRISEFMNKFGFGDYTGIDIAEETDAVMPSRGWKRARFNLPWYAGETVSVGIGQSYWTATPMQLTVATGILATGGSHFVPRLLHSSRQQGERVLAAHEEFPPIVLKNPSNWDVVHDAMVEVNNGAEGGARRAFKDTPYISAGKTGTAQVRSLGENEEYNAEEIDERYRDNAMYVGYAPADTPEVVIAIALENTLGGGGSVAAPVARQMLDAYFDRENQPTPSEIDDADD
ncbi:cell division protein FtsI [Idiomarina xiamenensis 10-D-4]|uniref:Peptidoglycan D,D-transpeptidase MrdA n=2 Tax=Idiomarina xiamenensis TaxID=1207041 RepID=K2K896_9GAMM|nr:cell division protein FtsI [Idiomarina xiamenensis 10-D-4]